MSLFRSLVCCFSSVAAPSREADAPAIEARDAPAAEIEAVLQEVLDRLGNGRGTRAGRTLRDTVAQALTVMRGHGARSRRGEQPRPPSMEQARQWLEEARFDQRINPEATMQLLASLRALEKQWRGQERERKPEHWSMPTSGKLYEDRVKLGKEIERVVARPDGKATFKELRALDAELRSLSADFKQRRAERDALIQLRVAAQARANPFRFPTGDRVPPDVAAQARRVHAEFTAWATAERLTPYGAPSGLRTSTAAGPHPASVRGGKKSRAAQ
jgi:hypothetical protein